MRLELAQRGLSGLLLSRPLMIHPQAHDTTFLSMPPLVYGWILKTYFTYLMGLFYVMGFLFLLEFIFFIF